MVSIVFFLFSAENGGLPVSMSYIKAPRLHQSTALPWPERVRISGAMYSMVPQNVHAVIPSWMCSLHKPKSVSLTWPWASSKTFSGFKSLKKIKKTLVWQNVGGPSAATCRWFPTSEGVPRRGRFRSSRSWKRFFQLKKEISKVLWIKVYQVVSSRKIPSRSKCMNSSPPLRYSRIKYSLPPVWNAYTNSTMNGCWEKRNESKLSEWKSWWIPP